MSVTAARFQGMLDDFVLPELQRLRVSRSRVWWRQDGATAHTAGAVLTKLQGIFSGKVISKGGSVPWPPRSPDLALPDFFLWGYLKSQVYRTPVRSLRLLKRRLRAAVRAVPENMVQEALAALPVRLRKCSRLRGGHMEKVLPHC